MPVSSRKSAAGAAVQAGHHVELLAEPLGTQPVRDLEVRRVVRQGEVFAAQGAGGVRHQPDG